MAEKVVSVRLQARVEGFTAGMRKAKASVDDLTKADVPKAAKGYSDLANKAALAGAAVAVGLGVAVKRFAEFDATMSAVKANTGGTVKEMESLRAAAVKLGADSQFSANEAAQGINELAKAGIQTADILNGGLKGALDLAAAGQIGVAEAAETTASAMTQFGLKGDAAVHVADLLASGANKAQGGVGDLSAALGQAGLVAAATGLSIEETAAGLTAFASAGLIGSDAGTSLKTMLQRLSNPMGDARGEMEKLGIDAYDLQGNFVGLAALSEQLKTGMEDLTPAQRNASMAIIFGSDAVRASNILYNEGAEGINKWIEAVDDQGAAARQAATLTDNLKGDIERLGGAFDSALIQTGSGANGSLRALVQGMDGLVTSIGEVPGPLLLVGSGLAAVALLAPKGILAFREYKAKLDSITESAPRAGRALNAFANAAAIGAAIFATAQAFDALGKELAELRGMRPEGVESAKASILEGGDAATKFADALNLTTGAMSKVDTVANNLVLPTRLLGGAMEVTKDNVKSYDAALADLVNSGNGELAAQFIKDAGLNARDAKAALPQYAESLTGVDNAARLAARSGDDLAAATANAAGAASDAVAPGNDLAAATENLDEKAKTAKESLEQLRDAIDGFGSAALAQRAAERDFQTAIDDAADRIKQRVALQKELKEAEAEPTKTKDDRKRKADEIARITEELEKYGKGFDANTEAGRANQVVLDGIAQATKEKAKADFDAAGGISNLDGATRAATKATKEGRDAFIDAATEAGMTKTAAKNLADQLGLIPDSVAIAVSQTGAAEAEAAIEQAARDREAIITVKRRFADFKAEQEDKLNRPRKATGGAIYGPGTGTSDSIPAWLSNGEHVWTAAEVAKLGGQSAMYALRAAVRQGRTPGFANGGAVTPQYAPPMSFMTMPSAGASSVTETHNAPIYIDKVMGPSLDDIERQAAARRRRDALSPSRGR